MAENELVLDGGWQFREAEPGELPDLLGREIPRVLSQEGWLPASVPGHVHPDLMSAGRLNDPRVGSGERDAWRIETSDFLYRTTFQLPEAWQRTVNGEERRVMLTFESLDTYANIYLNGECLHESANWFLPSRFEVTEHLRPGENNLLIHFESSVRRAAGRQQEHGRLEADWDTTRVYNRRPQYLTGSHVSPRISGCGIPGTVALRLLDCLRLRHLHVPIRELTSASAKVVVEADIEAFVGVDAELHCTVERMEPVGSGTNYRTTLIDEKRKAFKVRPGTFRFGQNMEIENATLWWPLGQGPEAHGRRTLYRARVIARIDGRVVDEQERVFGLRTVELRTDGGIDGFHFRINGQPVYARGAAWVPPCMFPGNASEDDYRRILDLAAAANINLLRVWGGGTYEREAFYRRCDELGIMVWQDFPFTRGEYPDYQAFWQNVQREASEQIRRIRSHPSLVLWCGNDEKAWWESRTAGQTAESSGRRIFTRLLPKLLHDYSPAIPYIATTPLGSTSPNDPREGDYHAEVWDNWEPADQYARVDARFISRFGFQSLPCIETLRSFTDSDDVSLKHADFESHQGQPEGNARILRHVFSRIRPPQTMDELVYMSQWIQGDAIMTAVDAWRAKRPSNMGCIVWHLNDCWPGISWSVLDHDLKPKLAYWMLRQAYSPVSLVFLGEAQDCARVVVVNDGRRSEAERNAICRIKAYHCNGELIDWKDRELEIPVEGTAEAGVFSLSKFGIKDAESCVLVGELCCGKTVIASSLHAFAEPRSLKLEEPLLEARLDCIVAKRRAVILVRSRNIVRGVEIGFEDLPEARVKFDNAFDIWPSREVWVNATIPADADEERILRSLRFRCLNDAAGNRTIQWRHLPLERGEGRAEDHSSEQINIASQLRMTDVVRKITD